MTVAPSTRARGNRHTLTKVLHMSCSKGRCRFHRDTWILVGKAQSVSDCFDEVQDFLRVTNARVLRRDDLCQQWGNHQTQRDAIQEIPSIQSEIEIAVVADYKKKPRAKNELLYTVVKLFLAVNPLVVALLHVAHIVQMPSWAHGAYHTCPSQPRQVGSCSPSKI